MPFDITSARREGYSDEEITNFLSSRFSFDVQGALTEGYSLDEISSFVAEKKLDKQKLSVPDLPKPQLKPKGAIPFVQEEPRPDYPFTHPSQVEPVETIPTRRKPPIIPGEREREQEAAERVTYGFEPVEVKPPDKTTFTAIPKAAAIFSLKVVRSAYKVLGLKAEATAKENVEELVRRYYQPRYATVRGVEEIGTEEEVKQKTEQIKNALNTTAEFLERSAREIDHTIPEGWEEDIKKTAAGTLDPRESPTDAIKSWGTNIADQTRFFMMYALGLAGGATVAFFGIGEEFIDNAKQYGFSSEEINKYFNEAVGMAGGLEFAGELATMGLSKRFPGLKKVPEKLLKYVKLGALAKVAPVTGSSLTEGLTEYSQQAVFNHYLGQMARDKGWDEAEIKRRFSNDPIWKSRDFLIGAGIGGIGGVAQVIAEPSAPTTETEGIAPKAAEELPPTKRMETVPGGEGSPAESDLTTIEAVSQQLGVQATPEFKAMMRNVSKEIRAKKPGSKIDLDDIEARARKAIPGLADEQYKQIRDFAARHPQTSLRSKAHRNSIAKKLGTPPKGYVDLWYSADLDNYKRINDLHPRKHEAGDDIMDVTQSNIDGIATENGWAHFHEGGDEGSGVIRIPEEQIQFAMQTIRDIKTAVNNILIDAPDGTRVPIGISIGVGKSFEVAENALKVGKETGKNSIHIDNELKNAYNIEDTKGEDYSNLYEEHGYYATREGERRQAVPERPHLVQRPTGEEPPARAGVTTQRAPETATPTVPPKPVKPKPVETPGTQEPSVASGQLAFGQKLPEKAPGINLKKVINEGLDIEAAGGETYSIKKFLLETTDKYTPKIDEARRGKIKLEQTRLMADKLGMSEKSLLKRQKARAYNAEQLVRANDILTTSAERVVGLRNKLASKGLDKITDEDIANIRIEMQRHAAVQAEFAGARAEAGRALSALRIMSKSYGEQNYNKILDAIGGRDINRKVIEKIISIDPRNEAAINAYARDISRAGFGEMFNEYWINAILSAPTTHIVNITSNILTAFTKPLIETPIAATLESFRGGKRRIFFREIPSQVFGMLVGSKEGMRSALKSFKTEQPEFDPRSKIETLKYQAIPGWWGKTIRTPGRALMAADEFFKHVIYRGQINSDAYKMARQEGLKGKDLVGRLSELRLNPTDAMVAKARKEAQYRTFTQELGGFGKKVMNLRSDWVDKHGKIVYNPLKNVIPFVRTPANIAKFALERTPAGFVTKASKLIKKDLTGEEIAEEFARPIVGSLIMAGAVTMAQQGLITGAGPKDRRERDALYRTGWQPYSILIGDGYYSYARLEPLGSLLGMAADFGTLKEGDRKLGQIAERMAYSVGRNITSKTYMQGLSDMVDAVSDPKRFGKDYINKMGASLVPNIIASGTRATDPKLRQVESLRDSYVERFPSARQTLLPRRDIWGREITRDGIFWTRFLSPIQFSSLKGDPVDKELVRINAKISQPNKSMKLSDEDRKKFGLKNVESLEMTPEELDVFSVVSGRNARKAVQSLMTSKEYRTANDQYKAEMVQSKVNSIRRHYRNKLKPRVARRYRQKQVRERIAGAPQATTGG